jgi:hypothetical protein
MGSKAAKETTPKTVKNVNQLNNGNNKTKNFTENELETLRKYFIMASGGDRVINFQEFIELFGHLNPQFIGPNIVSIAERAFIASDTNYDGHLK